MIDKERNANNRKASVQWKDDQSRAKGTSDSRENSSGIIRDSIHAGVALDDEGEWRHWSQWQVASILSLITDDGSFVGVYFCDGHFFSSSSINGRKGLYIKIVARTSTRRGWMRATGDGSSERELNGDGVCAVTQLFDNEGRRGGERRAPDERVYTFVYTLGDSSQVSGRKTRVWWIGRPCIHGGHRGRDDDLPSWRPGKRTAREWSVRATRHVSVRACGLKIGERRETQSGRIW